MSTTTYDERRAFYAATNAAERAERTAEQARATDKAYRDAEFATAVSVYRNAAASD